MAKKLMPGYKINLLRDFRAQTFGGWVSNDGYIAFLAEFPKLEKLVRDNSDIIKEVLDMGPEEFMDNLSKKRPDNNFNPGNVRGKKRPYWSNRQKADLSRVSDL